MTEQALRDGTTTQDRRLDRLVAFDERSRAFPVMAVVGTAKVPRSRSYRLHVHLDQGSEGACAEYGCVHEMLAVPSAVDEAVGRTIVANHYVYYGAQREDYWPGGAYPGAAPRMEGTSVLHAVKQVVRLGYATGYRWCFGLADVVMALGYAGPVIFGLTFTAGMMRPDPSGFIHATGYDVGGHCLLGKAQRLVWIKGTTPANKREPGWLAYLDLDASYVTLHQSWGEDHGDGGDVYFSLRDLDTMLKRDGEAVVLEGRRRTSKVPLS